MSLTPGIHVRQRITGREYIVASPCSRPCAYWPEGSVPVTDLYGRFVGHYKKEQLIPMSPPQHRYTIYRRNLDGSYQYVDRSDLSSVQQVLDYYRGTYLHDDANGVDVLIVENATGALYARRVVAKPALHYVVVQRLQSPAN